MGAEQQVTAHYTRGMLEEKILDVLRSSGKNLEQLSTGDLEGIDDLHVGGRKATEALGELMGLREGMHLLDVGSGLGGPARFFAERGHRVTGIDLTEEFVRVAESLTRMVKLAEHAQFRQGNACELPFEPGTFDVAYMIHVGMNVEDKASVFREVARVLKRGGRFAIFDIMRNGNQQFELPLPWAQTPETNFAAGAEDYRKALEAAGLRIDHQRGQREFAIAFMKRMMERVAASSSPVAGMQLLMGEQAPAMLRNIMAAIESGALEPVELVATAN
jgi:ubiquinone/menaquinone biosynthesis C-methylase UbiE